MLLWHFVGLSNFGTLIFLSIHKFYTENTPNMTENFVVAVKVMEKFIYIHNIKIPYIRDYTVIDKWKE